MVMISLAVGAVAAKVFGKERSDAGDDVQGDHPIVRAILLAMAAPGRSRIRLPPRDLFEYSATYLAKFKRPTAIDVVDDLPRLDNGKLYRHQLRARYR